MALILIDGYNLIGIAHKDLEKERNSLIQKLYEYAEIKEHKVTVVFDGWKNGQREESKSKSGNVTVIYSRIGDTADHVIKKIISSSSQPWIVVSSDREISIFASGKNLVSISSDEFESKLYQALDDEYCENKIMEDEETDLFSLTSRKSHKKLSRKERKKILALNKL